MILSLEKLRLDFKKYRKLDLEISARLDILISITKYELKYGSDSERETKKKFITAFLSSMDISDRTIQRWKNDYKERGPDALGKLKATGRPPVAIRRRIRRVITAYRKMYRWGSEVIQAHLKRDHNFEVSRHKIEKFLDDSGLRDSFPCTTVKRQKAQKKKQHTKVVVVNNPGAHTQMDVKYQLHLLTNRKKCYVYNFIDHASNWSFKHAYSAINERNTLDFMNKLSLCCPFEIKRLQTDNGIEFTFKYVSGTPDEPKQHLLDKFCEENSINHKLIPPGEKELQGLVERSHRQDDQELFSRINPNELLEFNELLQNFAEERNQKRRFKKNNWRTPNEWLNNYLVLNLAIKLIHAKELESGKKAKDLDGDVVTVEKLAA